jgi:hypothetical protein
MTWLTLPSGASINMANVAVVRIEDESPDYPMTATVVLAGGGSEVFEGDDAEAIRVCLTPQDED